MLDDTSSWIQFNAPILLDAIPDAVVVVDDHGFIVFVSLQSEKLFGYTLSELIGQSVEYRKHPVLAALTA